MAEGRWNRYETCNIDQQTFPDKIYLVCTILMINISFVMKLLRSISLRNIVRFHTFNRLPLYNWDIQKITQGMTFTFSLQTDILDQDRRWHIRKYTCICLDYWRWLFLVILVDTFGFSKISPPKISIRPESEDCKRSLSTEGLKKIVQSKIT